MNRKMKKGIVLLAFAAALAVYQFAAVEAWIGVIVSIVLGGYGVFETCRHARAGRVIPAQEVIKWATLVQAALAWWTLTADRLYECERTADEVVERE